MGLDVAEIGMGADLSLDLMRCFASKAAAAVRRQTTTGGSSSWDESAASDVDVDAYIRRLEEERGKIEVFRRELPLCARLLADVIDVMKEETEKKKKKNDLKEEVEEEDGGAAGDKSKWMSTAQLWTGGSGSVRDDATAETEKQDEGRRRNTHTPEAANSCTGAFTPPFGAVGSGALAFPRAWFRNDDKPAEPEPGADVVVGTPGLSLLSPPAAATIFLKSKSAAPAAGETESRRQQVVGFAQAAAMAPSGLHPQPQQQQEARKSRRCWSLELHRQFVAALNRLGGPQVATPKQIRELMKVDGLTNDEVKSHLQKYRLHNNRRRAAGGPAGAGVVISQPPIVVVGGGLWIPHLPDQEQSVDSGLSGGRRRSPQGPLGHLSSASAASGVVDAVVSEEDDVGSCSVEGLRRYVVVHGK